MCRNTVKNDNYIGGKIYCVYKPKLLTLRSKIFHVDLMIENIRF